MIKSFILIIETASMFSLMPVHCFKVCSFLKQCFQVSLSHWFMKDIPFLVLYLHCYFHLLPLLASNYVLCKYMMQVCPINNNSIA